jgi:hypothetical protein
MLLQINPSVPTYTPQQRLLAYLVVALILAGAAVVLYRLRYVGLEEGAREVRARVETQLAEQTPGSVRIMSDEDLAPRRKDIQAAFASAGAVEETTSLSAATGAVVDAVAEASAPVAARVPPFARRLLGLALLVLTLGILGVSTEAVVSALQTESSLDPIHLWPGAALRDTVAILDRLASLPVVGVLASLVVASAILLGQWLFEHYWVVAALLVVAAVRLATASDRPTDSWTAADLPTPQSVASWVIGAVLGGYALVLLGAGVGRGLADETLGRQVGAGIALLLILTFVAVAGVYSVRQVRPLIADIRDADGEERLVIGSRVLGILVAGVGAPLLPAWGLTALLSLPQVVTAFATASAGIKATALLVVLLLVGGLALAARDAAGDLRDALDEALARNGVRVALGARALPVGVLGLVYIVGVGFGAPAVAAAGLALVAAFLVRGLWALAQRVRRRAQVRPDTDPGVERVVVHAYRLETPAGTQWWARVNGEPVAHPEQSTAVDAVLDAARDLFVDGDVHPSVAGAHAEELREEGVAEIEETERRVRSRVRELAEGRVRSEGMIERDELEAELAERYPESIWREEWRRLRTRGPLGEREGFVFAD